MRFLRTGSIGSISAWLPSRRSTAAPAGRLGELRSGHVRSVGRAVERHERAVLLEGHLLRSCGLGGHQTVPSARENPPALWHEGHLRAPGGCARLIRRRVGHDPIAMNANRPKQPPHVSRRPKPRNDDMRKLRRMIVIRFLRKTLRLSMLGGIGYGVWKTVQGRRASNSWDADSWVPTPTRAATPAAQPTPRPRARRTPRRRPALRGRALRNLARPTQGRRSRVRPAPSPAAAAQAQRWHRARPRAHRGASLPPTRPRLRPASGSGWPPATACAPDPPRQGQAFEQDLPPPRRARLSRTHADRCYPDAPSAQSDGLRPAMR